MPTFVVTATRLNLRSAPLIAPGNVIASLPHAQEVEVVDRSSPDWWKVTSVVGTRSLSGFAASQHLTAAPLAAPASANAVTRVHLPPHPRSRRDSTIARFAPLSEVLPTRTATAPTADKVTAIHRIVDALDVERSARYRRTEHSTYCNIYAFDYCFLAGVYLPRVWWTPKALIQLSAGTPVVAKYEQTVRELSANALHDWLIDWGDDFGWTRTFDLTELQSEVNEGRAGVICAKRKEVSRPGHITCVVPEVAGHGAKRAGSAVQAPLQSQAGATNKKLFDSDWWVARAHEYADTGFFFCRP